MSKSLELPPSGTVEISDGPTHHPETAGHHLLRRVPAARGNDTVGSVLAALPGHTYDSVDSVYVLDEERRLQGIVRLRELMALPNERRIHEVMNPRPPKVHPDEDQEKMAVLAIRHGIAAVPVVDATGRLLGVVPATALISILRREHVEDLHRLAGIASGQTQAHEAIEASPVHRLRDRFPWLLVGLLGSIVATLVMARFERILEARIAVAFFVPAIVYLADAIGTQTEAIAVRYLTLSHPPLGRLLLGETAAGLLIGLSLGALIFPTIWLGFGDAPLAFAVSLAVVAAGGCAASLGLALPWLLSHFGKDPAFGSGPVVTIIQDVLSLLIYFGIVVILVV